MKFNKYKYRIKEKIQRTNLEIQLPISLLDCFIDIILTILVNRYSKLYIYTYIYTCINYSQSLYLLYMYIRSSNIKASSEIKIEKIFETNKYSKHISTRTDMNHNQCLYFT